MQKPVLWELRLDQIADIADQLAKFTDSRAVYYFGARRWDSEVSFGLVEFVLIHSNPEFFTPKQQEDLIDRLPLSFEVLLTFLENESDVMEGATLMWPPKS